MRRVDGNVHIVQADSGQRLVNKMRVNRPDVIERVGLIGTIEVFRRFGRRAIQRLILEERVVVSAELQPLRIRNVDIDRECIFALILRMQRSDVEVVEADEVSDCEVRRGIGFQNPEPVWTRLLPG